MLLFWISPPYDQASPCLVDLVTWNPRLQNSKSCIVRFTGSLDHLLYSLRYPSGSDEIVPLNVAAIAIIFDTKVQLHKVPVLDSRTVVSYVGHWRVADDHRGASVICPSRIQFSLSQKLVREIVDILVLLARLDRVLNRIVDLLALRNRLLHQFDLCWYQPRP